MVMSTVIKKQQTGKFKLNQKSLPSVLKDYLKLLKDKWVVFFVQYWPDNLKDFNVRA